MSSTEEWRSIAGYEGRYEVSSLGRVRSIDRMTMLANGNARHVPERILVQSIPGNGYPVVALHLNGQTSRAVHVLVAKAFLGPAPSPGLAVCHADGNRLNPAASNLRWDTRSANNRDQVTHGTHPHAFKTHCPAGHEYTDANTYIYDGRRTCRTCQQAARERYETRKDAS